MGARREPFGLCATVLRSGTAIPRNKVRELQGFMYGSARTAPRRSCLNAWGRQAERKVAAAPVTHKAPAEPPQHKDKP